MRRASRSQNGFSDRIWFWIVPFRDQFVARRLFASRYVQPLPRTNSGPHTLIKTRSIHAPFRPRVTEVT